MTLTGASLRIYMNLQGVTELVDDNFDGAVLDATSIKGHITTNETALKFYSAYLLTKSDKFKELQKSGDTSFFKTDPNNYLDLYNEMLDSITDQSSDSPIAGMIVNSNPKYN